MNTRYIKVSLDMMFDLLVLVSQYNNPHLSAYIGATIQYIEEYEISTYLNTLKKQNISKDTLVMVEETLTNIREGLN